MANAQYDTPVKASSVSITASEAATKAEDILKVVQKDLHKKVVLSSDFLSRIIPIDSKVTRPFLTDIKAACYDASESWWRGFPKPGEVEEKFYDPFVKLANLIRRKVGNNTGVAGTWVDIHTTSPTANADFVAEIRPDCAFVINPDSVETAAAAYDDSLALVEEGAKRPRSDTVTNRKPQNENLEVWWRNIIVVAEVKRKGKLHSGSFPQLCGYARQVLRQQLDRRFVLGMTLTFTHITMWVFDHSGAMGMSEPFNFHEEPDKFIHTIAAISMLPSHRLGWDPTMKLYDPSSQAFQASYLVRPDSSARVENIIDYNWRILLIDDRVLPNVTCEIILHHPLLLRTAECMNGRAVQVHLGYQAKDSKKEYRHPLVIKTSWQPISKIIKNRSIEAYHYEILNAEAHFTGRVFAASVVKAGHGLATEDNNMVSTFGFVRQGARMAKEAGQRENGNMRDFSKTRPDLPEWRESLAFMAFSESMPRGPLFFAENDTDVTDRVQTKLALNVYGWPIKFFTDLTELLRALKDAVIDHKHMWTAGTKVLHRDVSLGNIILKPLPPDTKHSVREMVSNTTGVLIDLDHAKSTTKTTTVPYSTSFKPSHPKHISEDLDVSEDIALQALTLGLSSSEAGGYVEAAQKANVLKSDVGKTWSSKDLGWKDIGEIPDFQSHQSDKHERTGTLPFMSYQLLNPHGSHLHSAIHDMESFWWILLYLCLTRKSGGGHRRDDVTDQLQTLVETLFETECPRLMYSEKSGYFQKKRDAPFKALLKAYVHDYFEPLKSLLTRWRDVLILGYEYEAYEYHLVHDYIVAIIDDTLRNSDLVNHTSVEATKREPLKEQERKAKNEELKRREREYMSLCNIPSQSSPVTIPQSDAQTSALMARAGLSPPDPRRLQATASTSSPAAVSPPSTPTSKPPSKKPRRD